MRTLFHKRPRKFRKQNGHKHRGKVNLYDLTSRLEHCLRDYKSHVFMIRSLILSLPKKSMVALWNIFQCWISKHEIPDRIVVRC